MASETRTTVMIGPAEKPLLLSRLVRLMFVKKHL